MKKFRTAFLGGYQREEVDEYIEVLLSELERLKTEARSFSDEKEKLIADLQASVEKNKKEKEKLLQELQAAKEAPEPVEDGSQEEIAQLKAKLQKYEGSYDKLSELFTKAEKEAEDLVSEARQKADHMLEEAKQDIARSSEAAKAEVAIYRQQTEEELRRKREEDGKNFMLAKYRLMEYIDGLNKSQARLVDIYNELGILVKKMPVRIEDVFSDEQMELLKNEEDLHKLPDGDTTAK